jgi:hypothetical protein
MPSGHSGYMAMEMGLEIGHLTMLLSTKREGGDTMLDRRAGLLSFRRRRREVVLELDRSFILFSKLLDPILHL